MKTICKIEEQYTGGGCEHLSVYFPQYDLEFTVMSADEYTNNQIPVDGEKWCFNLSFKGKWIEGEYLETSETLLDFDRNQIASWCDGYIIAKGYKKIEIAPQKASYGIDSLFGSINDIYALYDDGKMTQNQASEIILNCCRAFIQDNEQK